MAENIKKYTSTAELQDYWINTIAPKYFDFDVINNYRSGLFGYINEVMATITMDTHQSINVARREFYPVSAQNPQSIYKMAALQQINLPMAKPARCKAVLILDRDEVIQNSVYKNNIYTCVIDNSASILADNLPFSLVYPIVIVSNNNNGTWNHTIHYDKSISNSLDSDDSMNYYITNKTINQDGKKYLLLSVVLLQTSRESITQLVTTDSMVQTVSMLFSFEGTLANFEVFYTEEPDVSSPIQLKKLLNGQPIVETPFCYYRLLNNNLLEISFPKNIYFTPQLNSEIRLDVYTSEGKNGEFESFKGSLTCSMESELYPYNNNMTMMGVINGSCTNGKDIESLEEYTTTVQKAYSTNNTITTSNDLQIEFDSLSDTSGNNKIIFRKRRADAFDRTFGAYNLIKVSTGEVVPTNTLTINMYLDQFDVYSETTQKAFIKPGTLFTYDPNSFNKSIYTGIKYTTEVLSDELMDSDNFIYSNPFLIAVNMNPNLVGYYINSISETKTVEYSYINDSSIVQFIGSNLSINRNAMNGENFYEFSINISPTSEIDITEIIRQTEEDDDCYIKASSNGKVKSILYNNSNVICTLVYSNGDEEEILVGSYVEQIDGEYIYTTGYRLNVNVYDEFIEGDIIATKKVDDLGKIRACLEFNEILYANGLYIPMVIEEYDESLNLFTLRGYISTDDLMDDNGTILIDHGIMMSTGYENDNVSIKYRGIKTEISVFYENDDSNFTHRYSDFDYFRKHTLTNTYQEDSEDGIDLITPIDYIRSPLMFEPNNDDEDNYICKIKEIPLVQASWLKINSNFRYLINTISSNYEKLQTTYYNLENNFGIDLKFYNTYGKSKFFRAGVKQEWSPLSKVNCSFRFGVYLSSITSQATFLSQFREYVKERIESINTSNVTGSMTSNNGQSIYIMSILSDIQKKFPEIGYIEYYGFDEYESNIQKIEPIPTSEMGDELLTNYIPEFINISSYIENGETYPAIYVDFLNSTDE